MRHFLKITDLSKDDFIRLIRRARQHKENRKLAPDALKDKTIALLFEKSSTRTRLSFFMAITELGGNVISLDASDLQIGRGETIQDTTEVFGRYLDAVMFRSRSHDTVCSMAEMNILPIINGLTDLHHPCQGMADYLTMEQYGFHVIGDNNKKPLSIAFIGEGNNVFNSLALGAVYSGAELRLASPPGYEASREVAELLEKNNVNFKQFVDPFEAVEGANVVYTDVWISMGQESEREQRKEIFQKYQINSELLKRASEDHIVLHCLPAHRGEEITDEVMNGYRKSIFDQAENRLHIQKSILEWVFGLI